MPTFRRLSLKKHTKADILRHYFEHFPKDEGSWQDFQERYSDLELHPSSYYNIRKEFLADWGWPAKAEKKQTKKTKKKTPAAADLPYFRKGLSLEVVDGRLPPVEIEGGHPEGIPGTPDEKYRELRRENEYLRWLIVGERKGFLDRWLQEQKEPGS